MLEFDPETHTYRLDGDIIPSVTDLCKPLGEDIDESLDDVMDAAADRGVTCHKVLEMLLSGEADIEYPSAYEPYIAAIRLFLSEHEIIPLAVESPIYSEKMRVAGTPDLLCEFDGILTLFDWKFVSQIAKSKVKAQINWYRYMFNESGVFPEQLIVIQFLNTGLYRPYPVAICNDEFMNCYQNYLYKTKKHPRGRID